MFSQCWTKAWWLQLSVWRAARWERQSVGRCCCGALLCSQSQGRRWSDRNRFIQPKEPKVIILHNDSTVTLLSLASSRKRIFLFHKCSCCAHSHIPTQLLEGATAKLSLCGTEKKTFWKKTHSFFFPFKMKYYKCYNHSACLFTLKAASRVNLPGSVCWPA